MSPSSNGLADAGTWLLDLTQRQFTRDRCPGHLAWPRCHSSPGRQASCRGRRVRQTAAEVGKDEYGQPREHTGQGRRTACPTTARTSPPPTMNAPGQDQADLLL